MRLLKYIFKWLTGCSAYQGAQLPFIPALAQSGVAEMALAGRVFWGATAQLCCAKTRRKTALPKYLALTMLFFILFFILFLIFPSDALAWGPGVHMVTGNWVLQNLTALPPSVSEALMRYPGQYLHGMLSADIFIGKGCKNKDGHSHNWDSGFALLAKADNLRRQAYAFGYLSHLAADTVAHNVYVPKGFGTVPGSGRLAHVYIEMHADASLNWDSLDARGVFHEAGSTASERILRQTIRQKAWKYWVKKHIYEHSILLGGSRALRQSVRVMDRLFPGQERLRLLGYMLTLSTRSIVSMLRDPDNSPTLKLDPIGAEALSLAATRQSGRGLIIGSIKNIMHKSSPILPQLDLSAPPTEAPDLNIVLPDLMQELPEVCTPDEFMREHLASPCTSYMQANDKLKTGT